MEICNINDCTGCQACRLVCPTNAIKMVPDDKGFAYPTIDDSLCIKCNKCIKSCPSNLTSIKRDEPDFSQKVYAAWIKNKSSRLYSSSGGLFVALAEYVLQKNGVVFGVEWHEYGARHAYCTKIEDLKKFQGSKYVQSDVEDSYLKAEQFLLEEKLVLFSGTPCQIAGLKSYLGKIYDNLFTIDLICHGVPSPLILKGWLRGIEKEKKDKVTYVRFRHKTPSWFLTSVKLDFDKNISSMQSVYDCSYFRGFVENFYLRESCYQCKYANTKRGGDITLADFWHYSPSRLKFGSYDKGTSLVITNSEKGQNLFNSISSQIIFEEKEMELAQGGNRNLSKPQMKPLQYDLFWEEYFMGTDFNLLFHKYFPPMPIPIPKATFKSECKFWIILLMPAIVIRTTKKILNKNN